MQTLTDFLSDCAMGLPANGDDTLTDGRMRTLIALVRRLKAQRNELPQGVVTEQVFFEEINNILNPKVNQPTTDKYV